MTFLGDTEVRDFTGYRHFDLLDDDLRNDITFSHHEQQQELRLQNYSNGVLDVDGNDGNNYREQVTIHQQQQCQREEEPQQQASVEHGANPFKGSHPLVRRFWVFIGLVFSNPFIAMFIIVGSTITTSLLLWYALTGFETPHIDISLDSFQIPNHVSYIREDMFNTAIQDLTHRRKRDADEFSEANIVKHSLQKFLHGYQESLSAKRSKREIIQRHRNKRWKMSLVYLAKGDNEHNVFTEERLSVIHQIEKKIVGHKQFTDFCVKNYESYKDEALGVIDYCAPVNSLLTYFYPSEVNGKVMYDGMGSHLADIDGSLKKAMTHQTFYWYVDESMDKKNPKSRLLRSEVSFGMPIADCFWPDGTPKTVDEQHDEYVKFIVSYVSMLDKESTDSISVLYGGNELFDWEVQETFYHDLSMGAISGGLILVLVIILSSFSLWLSIWGFLTIAFSFALAFVVYRVCFGYESFGILIGISVFVVIGIEPPHPDDVCK
uniref:Patched domain-containing protein 2-like n=1 Tax=Saccoglossus kowalevskii TaxID=10224 RepID=A0ABM0M2B3_SACKO|nr:PREDICTED: patched domain-containing protein 2-like [Saccoglossus kowalevskii]